MATPGTLLICREAILTVTAACPKVVNYCKQAKKRKRKGKRNPSP